MKRFFVFCTVLFLLASCSTFKVMTSETGLQAITMYSVAKTLRYNPHYIDFTIKLTDQVIVGTGEGVWTSVEDVEMFMIQQIPWDSIKIEDQVLIRLLMDGIKKDLMDYLETQQISDPSQVMLQVKKVAEWINMSARMVKRNIELGQ